MFKKGPDIDKKKLLIKASDVKKDSLTRLKHFKTLIEHLDFNELPCLFKSHFSFIYHTFIDTFSTFDCNSKQRREDLNCIVFMLEKILVYNPELIKKRWQFYSITFVMQKLLHQNNTWRLRQEGVRLFVLWYQILCDESNIELQTIFGSLVPNVVPQVSKQQLSSPNSPLDIYDSSPQLHQHSVQTPGIPPLPIKLCSIDPLVPMLANEQPPNDETSFYLDNLLQFMVTQTTKPCWSNTDEARKNQELGFSFTFTMFKKIYLQHLFPNFSSNHVPDQILSKSYLSNKSMLQYVDETRDTYERRSEEFNPTTPTLRANRMLHLDLKQKTNQPILPASQSSSNHQSQMTSSLYQSIVIHWLTRILRQNVKPGQDEFIKAGSGERRDFQASIRESSVGSQLNDQEFSDISEGSSTAIFQTMEATSREMEIARRVIGTWSENIAIVHELFRRAFLNYFQPNSMEEVVDVYKEWICNGSPNQATGQQSKNSRFGYTSFGDLLQVFVLNSSNAFITRVHNPAMLDEQVQMCKRIMNIYRYMVMKIFMNATTWEQLLNVMLSITELLFPATPPERKETTIGGRIAPAFFQTFIVSWIRANLYVHVSNQMWHEFHKVMKNLVGWRELIEVWSGSTIMGSLTRVLVKHVYGLNLNLPLPLDKPLDKPIDRRRRPVKSFSTAEPLTNKPLDQRSPTAGVMAGKTCDGAIRGQHSSSTKSAKELCFKSLARSNSDGFVFNSNKKLYYTFLKTEMTETDERKIRKIKSECIMINSNIHNFDAYRSGSPTHENVAIDVIDGGSLKDHNIILDGDQVIESHEQVKDQKLDKKQEQKSSHERCVLLGGSVRGWTPENSVIMWRRMLGLFGNINQIEDPENHLVAMRCLAVITSDFIKTRENLGISIDNQSTPDNPNLIPPYIYYAGWLFQATHLPKQFKESRLIAYKLLCLMSIKRHDMELSLQYYSAFYDAIYRGLTSSDPHIHASIVKNSTRILSLELPGSTFLVQSLFERSRYLLLSKPEDIPIDSSPREQAIQLLHSIIALHKPLKKLMVLKSEINNPMNLAIITDMKIKIFETFQSYNTSSVIADSTTTSRSLCAMSLHVYQELCEKSDNSDVEKLFDTLLIDLQAANDTNLFRTSCDLLRLFADHAVTLATSKSALVSSLLQVVCQLIVKLSNDEDNKEAIHWLIICLEDWCVSLGKSFLLKPAAHPNSGRDFTVSNSSSDSLITVVLKSLENVINDEQYIEDPCIIGSKRASLGTLKVSDSNSISGNHSNTPDSGQSRERTMTNEQQQQRSNQYLQQTMEQKLDKENIRPIQLACKVTHQKILTYLGHFPLKQVGAATMACCVNESDYLTTNDQSDLTDLKDVSDISLLVINGSTIITFIGQTLNCEHNDPQSSPIHMIIRNHCGKYSWDASCIDLQTSIVTDQEKDFIVIDPDSFQQEDSRTSMKYDSDFNEDGTSGSSISSRSSSNRDYVGDLLNQLNNLITNNSSTQSCYNSYKKRHVAQSVSNPKCKLAQSEETMIALLSNQRFQELNYCERSDDLDRVVLNFGMKNTSLNHLNISNSSNNKQMTEQQTQFNVNNKQTIEQTTVSNHQLSFEHCRKLIQQLGYLSWEKRNKVESLTKSARLLRELKNLDSQPCRETHKIAVIYVANGQEDKNSILTNSNGSRGFEEFVAGLGWEVNLATHLGFMGGLQSNKSTGETSPYYCNSTTEVMFHVSTRIPINGPADDESLNRKLRHLGNDEIHIVWSEHSRDYRRGIIPTEFGDVIIAIYPMLTFNGFYRIQISSKQEVPLFGPLFDNCIVHQTSLAALVRATAINASRAKRLTLPYYQSHFEERNRLIETIVKNHKERLSFEDFAVQFYHTNSMLKAL